MPSPPEPSSDVPSPPEPSSAADGSGLRPTVLVQLVVLALLVAGSWWLVDTAADRALLVVVAAAVALGLVGARGPDRGSRLPASLQGVVVGGSVGVSVTLLATGAASSWGPLGALLVLPALYPAVVPARWRRTVTADWRDLAASR